MRGYTQNKNFTGSCAIIGRQGAYCGNVHYYSGEAYMTEHAVIAEPNNKANARFLAYYLGLLPLIRLQGQSAQPGLAVSNLRKLKLELPEMAVQERVAKLLSALDSKIEHNKRMSERLEKQAQLLYDYWFLQFDFPDENGRPYRSRGGKMVWNETLKREIPAGWKVYGIDEFFSIKRGVTYSSSDVSDVPRKGYTPILRANNIDYGTIVWQGLVYVKNEKIDSEQYIRKNDIIITLSSGSKEHVGKIACAWGNFDCSYGAFCGKLCIQTEHVAYIRCVLSSPLFRRYIKHYLLGTNINNINRGTMRMFRIPHPSNSLISQFQKTVAPIFERCAVLHSEIKLLSSLRDYLLPLLMTGQVRVDA